MNRRVIHIAIVALVTVTTLPADFTYEESSKITGGVMAQAMRFAGVFSKQAREPIRSTVYVKGDRMASVNPISAQIIDLGKETITEVDFDKKTYSVITFAEMVQAFEQAAQKVKESKDAEFKFNVSSKNTGASKQIAGLDAKQTLLTMEMEGTDKQSGNKGALTITTDLWLAPKVAGYNEVTDFYKRMAQKLAWSPRGGMLMARPDLAKGMAEVYKETTKLDGIPILQIVRMGGKMEGMPEGMPAAAPEGQAPPSSQQPEAPPPSAGGIAGDAAAGAATSTATRKMGHFGGLAGGLGGLGGLGRKKKQQEEEQPAPALPQQQAAGAPQQPGLLMEMTTELSSFSSAAVDSSKLEVPAGFKKVESETVKRMR